MLVLAPLGRFIRILSACSTRLHEAMCPSFTPPAFLFSL